jgi:hypothetical protein
MPITIRKTQKNDLQQISLLYEGRKSMEELGWLFRNPKDKDDFNSYVAVDENNEVVGAIGYAVNDYFYRNQHWTGVAPFSWIVKKSNRGLVGIQLILAIFKHATFGFALQGSEGAKKVYSMVKLKPVSDARIFVKLINPIGFIRTSHRNFFFNIAKALYYMPGLIGKIQRNSMKITEMVKYDNTTMQVENFTEAFVPFEDPDRINWLLDCPLVETYGFTLLGENKRVIGTCILYIKKEVKRGKIIYISHLGEDISLWEEALWHIFAFFKSKNCCSVSVLAHNPIFISVLKKNHFVRYTRKYNMYLRDTNSALKMVPVNTWHLTYFESDRGYITFNY